jgi:nucleotide-binding universal stress UspA family protein
MTHKQDRTLAVCHDVALCCLPAVVTGPLVVVEGLMQQHSGLEGRIVVGVDGSAPSKAALAWAVRQAKLTGAVVEAVIAWRYPGTYGYPSPIADDANYEELAARVVTDAIAEVAGPGAPAEITSEVVEGNPAAALLAASQGAELLVVGSRGHGGFVEALLGSVSQHCVHHAACPVVIIRDSAG